MATPFAFFICPVLGYLLCIITDYPLSAEAGALVIAFVELYSFTNSTITLTFIRPYREFLRGWARRTVAWCSCGRLCVGDTVLLHVEPTTSVGVAH